MLKKAVLDEKALLYSILLYFQVSTSNFEESVSINYKVFLFYIKRDIICYLN